MDRPLTDEQVAAEFGRLTGPRPDIRPDVAELLARHRPEADPHKTSGYVPQPGRPAMSQRATDASTLMLTGGAGTLLAGGGVSLTLWSLSNVSPAVLVAAAFIPMGLAATAAVVVKVAGRAAREVAEALPPGEHHHYEGPATVTHTEVHAPARWFGRTVNQIDS